MPFAERDAPHRCNASLWRAKSRMIIHVREQSAAYMLCEEGDEKMASLEKYTTGQVSYILRHNTREHPKPPANIDIDPDRSKLNYTLTPERGKTARECKNYYNERLDEVYHMNRANIITAAQWVITAPKDLAAEQEEQFFQETFRYLNSLYGAENCIQCIVHYDEGVKGNDGKIIEGRPHLHYVFLPIVENQKYMVANKKGNITKKNTYREKLCADELINKKHLKEFHPNYQKWLDRVGIKATVHSGITSGKSRTVEELKHETREIERQKEIIATLEAENQQLKERVRELEVALEKEYEVTNGWGSSWGSVEKELEMDW